MFKKAVDFDRVYIIAEIGVNHSGNVDLAKRMIDAAIASGADAVKFQTFTAEALVSPDTPKVKYQMSTTDIEESHYDMIKSLEFSREDHLPVIKYCKDKGIDFISTPYDVESAKFLLEQDVKIFKTASADITDLDLQEFLARSGKKVIISTGMASLGEIERVLKIYKKYNNNNISLLHCVSNYPCMHSSLNLSVISTLRNAFNIDTGFSDHSVGPIAAAMSVALGAKIIEKHFTLDKKMIGPDHKASSDPQEFLELTKTIRSAEVAMGSPIKECQDEEFGMSQISRKSLVSSRDIKAGTILKAEDFVLRRPGNGIQAYQKPLLIGQSARNNIAKGQLLKFSDIEFIKDIT